MKAVGSTTKKNKQGVLSENNSRFHSPIKSKITYHENKQTIQIIQRQDTNVVIVSINTLRHSFGD